MNEDLDPSAWAQSRRLDARLREEARARGGRLPFDHFMERVLYAPGLGYYTAGAEKFGPGGDFVTAPLLSPLFGRSLARHCAQVLRRLGEGEILELGAGTGDLAVDLLEGLEAEDVQARYAILELSPELRARQRDQIARRRPDLLPIIRWCDRLPRGFRGLILANEVADALPVHRFQITDGGGIEEIFAVPRDDGWGEVIAPPESPGLAEAVRSLQDRGLAREPGYRSEIALRLGAWIRALAESLERGSLLLIDYGYSRAEYYHPARRMGTLRCHFRHRAHSDPYRNLGLQDISAHVDFSALADAGRRAGLQLAGFATQAHFLLDCGIEALIAQRLSERPDPNELLGVKQLLLPTGMGERFQVITLTKALPRGEPWRGFRLRDLRHRLDRFRASR